MLCDNYELMNILKNKLMQRLLLALFLCLPLVAEAGLFCLQIDEKRYCGYETQESCDRAAQSRGLTCSRNYSAKSNLDYRYCVTSKYGRDCSYRNPKRCRAVAEMRDGGCVENVEFLIREKEKRRARRAAGVCNKDDITCQLAAGRVDSLAPETSIAPEIDVTAPATAVAPAGF